MFFLCIDDIESVNKWFYRTKKIRKRNIYKIFKYNWNFSKSSFLGKRFTCVTLTKNHNVISYLCRLYIVRRTEDNDEIKMRNKKELNEF